MLNYWNEYVHRALVMAITSLKIWLPFVTDILWYAHVLQSHLATYGITTFVINIHVSYNYAKGHNEPVSTFEILHMHTV